MALLGKINDTVIKVAANNCEYCWYCIEDVGLQEHNAWLLNDDFTGLTVDGLLGKIIATVIEGEWNIYE